MKLKNTGLNLFKKVKRRTQIIKQKCPTVVSVYWGMLGPRRGDIYLEYNREAAYLNEAASEYNKANRHLHFMWNAKAIRVDRKTGLPELNKMEHLLRRDPETTMKSC